MLSETAVAVDDQQSETAGVGRLVVVSGPSGVGKTVICEALIARAGCERAITATSRPRRTGEQQGVDYYFHDVDSFRREIENGGFLEHAEVHGNLYGTPAGPLEKQLGRGETVLLNIDVQGAGTLMDRGVPATYIFLEPPSLEVLEERLRGRSTEDPEAIRVRLENARQEMAVRDRYEFTVVNSVFEETVSEIIGFLFPDGVPEGTGADGRDE